MDKETIDFKQEVVLTSLKHTFCQKGYFDICTLDNCLKVIGAIPNKANIITCV